MSEYPSSKAPRFAFADTLEGQEGQLRRNRLLRRMREARRVKADAPHRPLYHFVNPEYVLNDPNGLCFWQGRWHLFYQARPPEDPRQHWGHAVSTDLVHWRDLPCAIGPGPEDKSYSGTILVEEDRAIAMYHGMGVGNMVAVSNDPLLLNWRKVTGRAVIPFGSANQPPLPYGVFDPCIWSKGGSYYALSAGIVPFRPGGRHIAANYLFRSPDLEHWEYLHPFVEGDRFTRLGDDGACPYFRPIGDRHILVFFSHLSGSQYLLGDYDTERDKFQVDAHGLFTFGPVFPGGVHAPTAFPDGEGGVIVMCNMNPARPTGKMDNYLSGFFGGTEGWLEEGDGSQFARDWDQILTLPRRLTLSGRHEVCIEPAGDIASLRSAHRHIGRTVIAPNREVVLDEIEGDAIELSIEVDPKHSSAFEVDVLRSPGREECTRICLYHRRGFKYREPLPHDVGANCVMSTALSTVARYESVITIDNSCSSMLPDALSRPPESAPVLIDPGDPVHLRIFVDRSVVEVIVNGRQSVAVRVYPGRPDSKGVSLTSRGHESTVFSLDCWQMHSIYE